MGKSNQPTVTVYRRTLNDIIDKHKTSLAELSRRCGYNSNYLSYCFSRDGEKVNMKLPLALSICYALGIKKEDLMKIPKPSFSELYQKELSKGERSETASDYVTKKDLEDAIKQIDLAIRESTNFLHCDLRALLKVWTPKQEPISIGGDASK